MIDAGSYTSSQIQEMAELIKTAFPPEFRGNAQITFPIRAAIAMNSTENIRYLLNDSGVSFASPSVTLWEGASDPRVDETMLQNFISVINASRVFVDLPYSFERAGESVER